MTNSELGPMIQAQTPPLFFCMSAFLLFSMMVGGNKTSSTNRRQHWQIEILALARGPLGYLSLHYKLGVKSSNLSKSTTSLSLHLLVKRLEDPWFRLVKLGSHHKFNLALHQATLELASWVNKFR